MEAAPFSAYPLSKIKDPSGETLERKGRDFRSRECVVCLCLLCRWERGPMRFQNPNNSRSLDQAGWPTPSPPDKMKSLQAFEGPRRGGVSGGQRHRGPATLESGSGPQWLPANAWVSQDPNRSQAGTRSRSPRRARSPSFPKAPLASGAAAAPPWQRWPISPPPTPPSRRRRLEPRGTGRGGCC